MSIRITAVRGFESENLVADLFQRLGYRVQRNVLIDGLEIDQVIEMHGSSTPVEVKFVSGRSSVHAVRETAVRMLSVQRSRKDFAKPLIVVVGEMSKDAKAWAQSQFDVRIWDAQTLMEMARPYGDLRTRLATLMGVETLGENEQAVPERPAARAAELITRLERHERDGGLSPAEYEGLCQDVMVFLFDPHLFGFEPQHETSDGANRYDFICRIKPGDLFWDSIRTDFRTRSILFECKNYQDRITADQVYSTERYLFTGALRTVCLLMSRKGPDEGCARAAQGALRESGKLILLLSNADMVQMLLLKSERPRHSSAPPSRSPRSIPSGSPPTGTPAIPRPSPRSSARTSTTAPVSTKTT